MRACVVVDCKTLNLPNDSWQCAWWHFIAVTETCSCTKGSVFLINYSPTSLHSILLAFWKWFSSFSFRSHSQRVFMSGSLRGMLLFCGWRMSKKKHRNNYLFILRISPQISLLLFRLFLGGCELVLGAFEKCVKLKILKIARHQSQVSSILT